MGSLVKFSPILFIWYIFPVVIMLGAQFIVDTFHLRERWKIKAPDLAVPFLVIGIHEISKAFMPFSILPYVLLGICLLGIAVVIFQAYRYREIVYGRFFKMFWRLTFLIACLLYLVMIIVSVIRLV